MDEFVELVKKANQRGIYTVVCDGYPNGAAKKFAKKAYTVDISEIEAIAEICREENIDGIISSFSDVLFESMAKIAEKAGLKTYCTPEKAAYLREKSLMKQMFQELKIPTAASIILHRGFDEKELGKFHFPVVMKPVNGYGSRGIYVVNSIEEIRKLFDQVSQYSSFADDILVEEYNSGYEFNMMNWLADGEVYTLGLADREKSEEIQGTVPHVSRICYPSRMLDKVYTEAKKIVKKVADFTGIQTGPISMQFFYAPEKGIEVCECAGRLFGYEHELVTLGSGFDIEELLLDYIYDESRMKAKLKEHTPCFGKKSAGLYFHGYEGKIADMEQAVQVISEIHPAESMLYYKEGDEVSHGRGAKPYLIRLYLSGDSQEEIDMLSKKAFEEIKIFDEHGNNMVYHNAIEQRMEKEK